MTLPTTHDSWHRPRIAIDQAKAIVGILPDEWIACHVEITNDDGTIPWSHVA